MLEGQAGQYFRCPVAQNSKEPVTNAVTSVQKRGWEESKWNFWLHEGNYKVDRDEFSLAAAGKSQENR